MVKVTLKDGTVVEGTSEEIYALDLFVETDVVESVEVAEDEALKVGDRVRTLYSDEDGDIPVGSFGNVTHINCGNNGDPFSVRIGTSDDYGYFRPEYLELITEVDDEHFPLDVGDYAVVLKPGIGGADVFTPGQIVKVTFVQDPMGNVLRPMVKSIDGQHEWYMAIGEEIRKADVGEVAQAEADAIEHKRTEVFTANGRKVNEYREGDIARITFKNGEAVSIVGDVEDVGIEAIGVSTNTGEFSDYNGAYFDEGDKAEPIVFVENRLDRK